MNEDKAGKNIRKRPVTIKYKSLEKLSDDKLAVFCPDCGGVISMQRDQIDLHLLNNDRCLLCGQSYIFTDIEEVE